MNRFLKILGKILGWVAGGIVFLVLLLGASIGVDALVGRGRVAALTDVTVPITDPAQLSRLPGPLLGIFGAEDTSIPLEEVAAFDMGLTAAQIPHEITIYPGVGHAFVVDIATIQAGGPAGEAWAQFLRFLRDNL